MNATSIPDHDQPKSMLPGMILYVAASIAMVLVQQWIAGKAQQDEIAAWGNPLLIVLLAMLGILQLSVMLHFGLIMAVAHVQLALVLRKHAGPL